MSEVTKLKILFFLKFCAEAMFLPFLALYYKNLGFNIVDYPNAYDLYHNEITLPLYSKLTNEEVDYIIDAFIKVLGEFNLC